MTPIADRKPHIARSSSGRWVCGGCYGATPAEAWFANAYRQQLVERILGGIAASGQEQRGAYMLAAAETAKACPPPRGGWFNR